MRNESLKTLTIAAVLCLVCSVLVAGAAVLLKPMHVKNREIDVKKNILLAAKLIDENAKAEVVEEEFKNVETVLVNMTDGSVIQDQNPEAFDEKKASKNKIPHDKDIAGLSELRSVIKVYLVKNDGELKAIILPVISKGLWSTMLGFMALESDANTIKGFSYYSHGETPGLGGEVDNPRWKNQFIGKKIFDEDMSPEIDVVKKITKPEHEVDALSGATLTSVGVGNSLKFWFGDYAYKPFLKKLKEGEI